MLRVGLGRKTRIPSTQESYLLLFIWSPLLLCLMCSLLWVSYLISRTPRLCRLSEFQNFPSWQTACSSCFLYCPTCSSVLLLDFSHWVIMVLSPKSSLSWSPIAPFLWVWSPEDYCWESEFNRLQNTTLSPTACFFFFFQKGILLLRVGACYLYVQMSPCLLIFTKGGLWSVLGHGTGSVKVFRFMFDFFSLRRRGQGRIYNTCSLISLDQSFRILREGERNCPRLALWQGLPCCTQVSFPPGRGTLLPSLMDRIVPVMSLLWQCPHISYIVWNEPSWNGCGCAFYSRFCWRGKFAPVWSWHHI